MGRDELEEILEECLSALLEGRRTVEESLSLYPAWRGRLEPLLRAAEEIAAGLDAVPPPFATERGLQRFLEAARTRRRLREIVSARTARPPLWRWASTGLAAAIVAGVLASIAVTLATGDGDRRAPDSVSISPFTPTRQRVAPSPVAAPLRAVQQQVTALEQAVRSGQPVEVELLAELEKANDRLAANLEQREELNLIDLVAAVSIASKEHELLTELQGQSSGDQALAVESSLESAANVLNKVGVAPTPTATATPAAAGSPSPAATATPLETPPPSGTTSPSPSPTPRS